MNEPERAPAGSLKSKPAGASNLHTDKGENPMNPADKEKYLKQRKSN